MKTFALIGMHLIFLLVIILVVLYTTGHTSCGWFWCFSPLWISAMFVVFIGITVLLGNWWADVLKIGKRG